MGMLSRGMNLSEEDVERLAEFALGVDVDEFAGVSRHEFAPAQPSRTTYCTQCSEPIRKVEFRCSDYMSEAYMTILCGCRPPEVKKDGE